MQIRKKSIKKLLKSRKPRKTSRKQSRRKQSSRTKSIKKLLKSNKSRKTSRKKYSNMNFIKKESIRNFLSNMKNKSRDFIDKFRNKKRVDKKEEDFIDKKEENFNSKNRDTKNLYNNLNILFNYTPDVNKKAFNDLVNNNPYNAMKYFIGIKTNSIKVDDKTINDTINKLDAFTQ